MVRSYAFDFRGGQIDRASFPARALARAAAHAIKANGATMASDRDPFGWAPLRNALAHRLVARGVACTPDDVLIVGGAQQALDLVGRVLVDPGDTVVVEQPGYFGAALAFRAAGAHLVGVRVDEGGLRTDDVARLLRTRRAKLVYVTPAVQCPTGVTLAEPRREALLALADAHQVPILEDDYDSELRLGAPALPALKARDAAGQVIYVGTFSKAFFPGMRIGYVVAPRPLLERLAAAHLVADFQTSPLPQATMTELITGGVLEHHVRRVRRVYAERLAAMREALARGFPPETGVGAPLAGNAVWVTLPPDVDGDAVAAAARTAGIA
jgi:GntR family transcriptional regulator/MocR family aminotransferase